LTRELIRAGQLLHISVLDHLVMGRTTEGNSKDYCSLSKPRGLCPSA
jgi:DNA repair protein RadC